MEIQRHAGDKRMSLLDATPEVMDILRGDSLEYCNIVDVYLDDVTLHYSDMFHSININDGVEPVRTYLPLATRLIAPDDIETNQSLDDTSIEINLDSSRVSDGTDAIGALVDNNLNQRRVRIRTVLFRPDTNRTDPIWVFNIREGVIDGIDDRIRDGQPSLLTLRVSSGSFAFNERRNWTYSHTDQQVLYPSDTGFLFQAQLADVKLPWRGEFR